MIWGSRLAAAAVAEDECRYWERAAKISAVRTQEHPWAGLESSGGAVLGRAARGRVCPRDTAAWQALTQLSLQRRRLLRRCCETGGATPLRLPLPTDCTAPPSPRAGGSHRHRQPGHRPGRRRHLRRCGTGTGTPSPPSERSWVSLRPQQVLISLEGWSWSSPRAPSLTCPFSLFSADDFESKYSFHPVEDFPAPEEYKYFQRIYPSKTNRGKGGGVRLSCGV